MAREINLQEVLSVRPLRVAEYGLGGDGKTSSLHLPESGPGWEAPDGSPGKVAYIAADPTSQNFRSFSEGMKKRLLPVIPDGDPTEVQGKDPRTGKEVTYLEVNWRAEIARLCQTDWQAKNPDTIAVIWDTASASAEELLSQSAQRAEFSDKGPSAVGKGKVGLGKEEGVAMPQEGDYHMAGKTILRDVKWLLHKNKNIHVFVLWHTCFNTEIKKFGPMHVGSKGPLYIPQLFDMCVNVSIVNGKTKMIFRHADFVTNLKCADSGKVPEAKLIEPTEAARHEFWRWVQEVQG